MAASRTAYPGTISPGDAVTAANNNLLPGGVIGRDEATSNTAFSPSPQLAATVAVTVGANRYLIVMAVGICQVDSVGGGYFCLLQENDGSGAVQIQRINFQAENVNQDAGFMAYTQRNITSAGTYTYNLLTGPSGGGQAKRIAAATSPCLLTVIDMGPKF